jgi:uncharacterized protein YcfJ
MSTTLTTGAIMGIILVTAGGALTGYKLLVESRSAEVVSATPLSTEIKTPRQFCHDEQVTRAKPVKDRQRMVGTGVGAVVGGIVGHQLGNGSGRDLATVAGAAAGGYAGNKIQQQAQRRNTETVVEQRCATVYEISREPAGYDVAYRLDDKVHHIHMDHNPGARIPLTDGKVTVASAQSSLASN